MLSVLGACGGGGGGGDTSDPPPPQTQRAKWTYLVYVAGDNDLSNAAILDINEMEKVGSSADVNVVVQVEFSTQFSNDPYAGQTPVTLRGRIEKDNDPQRVTSPLQSAGGNLDMGSAQTLRDFIAWAKSQYPADHYALALWSHGAGWKFERHGGGATRGVLQDQSSGTFMSLDGVAQAIRGAGVSLDVLNFDSCLMGMYEVVYALGDLAKTIVASEEVVPGDGDPYDAILADLHARPAMTGAQLAQTMVDRYQTSYQAGRSSVTKSVVSSAGLAQLRTRVDELATYLSANLATLRPAVQTARDAALSFQYKENKDLGDFLDQLDAASADAGLRGRTAQVRSAMSGVVTANRVVTAGDAAYQRASGLSIFVPKISQVSQNDLTAYATLPTSTAAAGGTSWGQFVNQLVTGDTGVPQQEANGNFAVCIQWADPQVDIDLYVYEPRRGELYAAWMGPATPNGFFSGDSIVTGLPAECYAASSTVEKGDYDVFVNAYSANAPVQVQLYLLDASTGNQLQPQGNPFTMSFATPSPDGTNPVDDYDLLKQNRYSDWFFPGTLTRAMSLQRLPVPGYDAGVARAHFDKRRLMQKAFGSPAAPGTGGKS